MFSVHARLFFRNTDVSINTVPLSILKLYAKNQTCFRFVRNCSSEKPDTIIARKT